MKQITIEIVQNLIRSQFFQWKDLSIIPIVQSGWDNRTFHLGDEMIIRLPSDACYAGQPLKEFSWLSKLAPHLSLEIPLPIALGNPSDKYPWHWSIYKWIKGESASVSHISGMNDFAQTLATFLKTLHTVDPSGGPLPGPENFYRGGSLAVYDHDVCRSIEILKDSIDVDAAKAIWQQALSSTWSHPPVWVHGDIAPGNLLVRDGELVAVIDFGQLAVGDPACDLAIAWTFFEGESREIFKRNLSLDDATWARARGWALWKALIIFAGLSKASNEQMKSSCEVIKRLMI